MRTKVGTTSHGLEALCVGDTGVTIRPKLPVVTGASHKNDVRAGNASSADFGQ